MSEKSVASYFSQCFHIYHLILLSYFPGAMVGYSGNGGDSKIFLGTEEREWMSDLSSYVQEGSPGKSCNWTPYLCSKQRISRTPMFLWDLTTELPWVEKGARLFPWG